ncbi:MAG: DNA repair protein RecN [Flavobacteriaceae bacterium]|nr:DNA repair protein RecN [Flavobacteriaceae bacterium]
MLASLSIKNFAIIDNLHVNFEEGFSIITGETGAGKSILLGGLALILGKRADLSSLKIREKKCIIEGEFLISKYDLQDLFDEHDLDFEERTIIRREILPNGKSRAFINDTPTTLTVLATLSDKLIDVHSQHQTLELSDINYQFLIIDSLADNGKYLKSFKEGLNIYKRLNNEFKALLYRQQEETNQYEYNAYLLKELNDANFKVDEQSELEDTLEKLNHIEEIKLYLTEAKQLFEQEELGISDQLNRYAGILSKLSKFSKEYEELSNRLLSLKIEIDDITQELDAGNENIEYSPAEIEKYNNRLQLIYDLQKKHKVNNIEELLDQQQRLNIKVSSVENASEIIAVKEKEILELENRLNLLSITLRKNRQSAIPELVKQLEALLKELEMPKTTFKINLIETEGFSIHGKDELEFLISTNKGSSFDSLKKIASGGEMSRIMLAVKSILCNYSNLPTIIFDEIDTGVSGEVSNRIATVMSAMSKRMQVIAITHLPQIAAKGTHHFKVYKEEINNRTVTNIKLLSKPERVSELAEMLSGKEIIDSAIVHAKQLLNQ